VQLSFELILHALRHVLSPHFAPDRNSAHGALLSGHVTGQAQNDLISTPSSSYVAARATDIPLLSGVSARILPGMAFRACRQKEMALRIVVIRNAGAIFAISVSISIELAGSAESTCASSETLAASRTRRYCCCFTVVDSLVTVFSAGASGFEASDLTSVLRELLLDSVVVLGGGAAWAGVTAGAAAVAAGAAGAC
jgi:hypothetical protein